MGMRHNHFTRDIKPVGQCPGCDQSRRWGVLNAALTYADLEMLSISVAAPAAGLYEARARLLDSVKALIGVDHTRWNEHGHISYRMMEYKKLKPPALDDDTKRYREALERIAREDYRGPRPESATIAYYALHPEEKP